MTTIHTVLLIEDNLGDARLLREMFRDQGALDINLIHVQSMGEAESCLAVSTSFFLPAARMLPARRSSVWRSWSCTC